MLPDENYRKYATDRQWECYLAYCEHGSERNAANELGISKACLGNSIRGMKKCAAKYGYSPDHGMDKQVPDGFNASRVSTNYDEEGNIRQQWVIATVDKERQAQIQQEVLEALKDTLPRYKPVKPPKTHNSDILATYPIGDHHLGMLAWHEEGTDDYDLEKGENLLVSAITHLAKSNPKTDEALLVALGDFLHFDGMMAVTPQNRNLLDSDSRFPKIVRCAIRVLRKSIEILLTHHNKVKVILETGNHDPASTVWLRELFSVVFEDEPRLEVDTSPKLFHFHEFGKNLIGTHHGDRVKMADLPLVMASEASEAWGRTLYRHIMTGHIHHDSMKEFRGCKVESFRVLPPSDAYGSSLGYAFTGRDMKSILFHVEHGEIGRNVFNPLMLV